MQSFVSSDAEDRYLSVALQKKKKKPMPDAAAGGSDVTLNTTTETGSGFRVIILL